MMQRALLVAAMAALLCPWHLVAQGNNALDAGQITGNVQLLFQTYQEDTLIGAQVPPSKTGFNAFGNLIYTRGNFSAGMRYESYLDPILGYPGRFRGSGVGYRYANYSKEKFEITLGNFYEQFGSGLLLRAYEERQLGIDNALDGFRIILRPTDGINLKGLVGKQRLDFDSGLINGPGTIRAIDGEINLNDAIDRLASSGTRITLGASFVSRYQSGSTISKDTLVLQLPNNVGSWGYRAQLQKGGFQLMGEYVRKINDPNADNGYTYGDGEGILINAGWSTKGLGINVGFKGVDNMQFRSDRNLQLFDVPVNYIPAITKQHTYNLAATLYPYATVVQGEVGWSAEVFYTIPRKSKLGGKYGTKISFQYATASSLDTTNLTGVEGAVDGYVRNSWNAGSELFIRDINFDISRKFSKNFKAKYAYFHFDFNTLATPVTTDYKGIVNANVHVLETQVRIKKGHSLRTELQTLFTGIDEKTGEKQDKGDWATVLAEYTISPHWFFSVLDQYNFGNPDPDQRVHYLYGTVGRIEGAHRLSIGYGKRREGIFCIGGVCRAVPASNGFEITFTSSF